MDEAVKNQKGRGSRFGFRGLEAAIAADWSTGWWSPGTDLREVALGGREAHVAADVADPGARPHLDAGDSRNGRSLEGGLAISGHAERRSLGRLLGLDAVHVSHLLRLLGADRAKGRDALSITSWEERDWGRVVSGKPFSGYFPKNFGTRS
jgi:hypothetical protein